MNSNNESESPKWYNKLLDKVKSYQKQVGELESSVIDVRQKYEEVLARNVYLEDEIKVRTVELDKAQKSILTLQHIWDTMRSAEPLGNVLSIVCNSLIENLDYNFCCIMQMHSGIDGPALRPRSYTENSYLHYLDKALGESLITFYIQMNNEYNLLVNAIENKKIIVTKTFQTLLEGSLPEIDPEKIRNLDVILGDRAIVIVPLSVEGGPFGALYGVSQRTEITDKEKKFLRLFADQIELAVTITKLFEQVREQAITDGLTKISNRRHFDQCLAQEVERSLRLNQPFTLISLDMDHLKLINDTHGHSAGDAAITHIATVLRQNARAIDMPARFGGEEFVILLPGVDIEGGTIAAERIRHAIEVKEVEGVGTVTASIGVATFLRHTNDLGELLELADQAMYEAKQNGRNQVRIAKSVTIKLSWQELALDAFINVLTQKHTPLTPDIARDLVKRLKSSTMKKDSFVDVLNETVDQLISIADVSHKDGHSENIVKYSVALAARAGLPDYEIDRIRLAALLHDLGKMSMPQKIISKPGPLDNEEWNVILKHPVIAAREIIEPLHSIDHVIPIVEHHHEHWDGTGYPSKLAGENIPIGSRIILIVDAYCAMTTKKPYREALTKSDAIEALRKGTNTTWDGALIEMFISLLEEEDAITS